MLAGREKKIIDSPAELRAPIRAAPMIGLARVLPLS
jgi:hypothetical protein